MLVVVVVVVRPRSPSSPQGWAWRSGTGMFLWGCLKQRRREAKGRHGGGYPRYQDCRERGERPALVLCPAELPHPGRSPAPGTAVPTLSTHCPLLGAGGCRPHLCTELVRPPHRAQPRSPGGRSLCTFTAKETLPKEWCRLGTGRGVARLGTPRGGPLPPSHCSPPPAPSSSSFPITSCLVSVGNETARGRCFP